MLCELDLSSNYNHIIYKQETIPNSLNLKTIYGIPHTKNIHIVSLKKEKINAFGIDFKCSSINNIFDNIMCDGQIINVERKKINGIAFLGFSEMGTVCDEINLGAKDTIIPMQIVLKTFHTDRFRGIDDIGKNAYCKLAFYVDGDDGQKHGIFFWKINLLEPIVIDFIKLPVNCALHLMAITLI